MSNYRFLDYRSPWRKEVEGKEAPKTMTIFFVLYLGKVKKFQINTYMCLIISARGGPLTPPPPQKKR